MRRNPIDDPVTLIALLALGGGVAWYVVGRYRAASLPPPTAAGTGDLCSPGTVFATIGIAAGTGAATGLAAGAAPGVATFGIAAAAGAIIGGIAGTFAGIGKVLVAQRQCDQAVCGNLQAAYNDVITRGQGGGRIAKLVRLVGKARRRGETCNGMTDTAGLVVGR